MALLLGSLYYLWTKNVFLPWARATVMTFIIWSIIYALLLLGHIRLKGLQEFVFAASGAIIFYIMLNPAMQAILPFSLVLDVTGNLALTDQIGNIILASQYLPWVILGLGVFIIWRAGLVQRLRGLI